MVAPIKACLGVSFLAAVALWSGASSACQLELDTVYSVTPFVDDGLSRAERVTCALGELHYYDEKQGWLTMLDESGGPLQVRDMAGVLAPTGELLVVILKDNRVAMRWGGPGRGDFFADDAEHRSLHALDEKGERLTGLRIDDVSIDRKTGLIQLGIETESGEHCGITSDDQHDFHWNWECGGVSGDQQQAALNLPATSTGWTCRNNDLEIGCDETGCEVSTTHTPMDITVDHQEMSVCAYSGCWSGNPAAVTSSGSFLTFTGVDLPFSTAPEDRRDIAITIETTSRVATILVAGQYANPATCQPR